MITYQYQSGVIEGLFCLLMALAWWQASLKASTYYGLKPLIKASARSLLAIANGN
jgi:hypothetical protein